jgi:hypothetical protein
MFDLTLKLQGQGFVYTVKLQSGGILKKIGSYCVHFGYVINTSNRHNMLPHVHYMPKAYIIRHKIVFG